MAKKTISMDDTIKRGPSVTIPQRGGDSEKKVALTLKLPESDYERLAVHGAKTRQKHQHILHRALLKYLDDAGA